LPTLPVYRVVRRASRRAMVAPDSRYAVLLVVMFGVHVEPSKYTPTIAGVINRERW